MVFGGFVWVHFGGRQTYGGIQNIWTILATKIQYMLDNFGPQTEDTQTDTQTDDTLLIVYSIDNIDVSPSAERLFFSPRMDLPSSTRLS